ncbi:MAG: hypothetical protein LBR37_02515 [Erysipelotrichaceae bacterium]|jgi:hypothetical protein|nr:hypothetical protein [Erysipelotrichaceae bacterium]
MDNKTFLDVLGNSFKMYLASGPRSNEKLKILHGAISVDLQNRIGYEFLICSLGFKQGHEQSVPGRYMDKTLDITVSRNERVIAGLAIKFVMSNYSQNSNNYFENMLGETANLRSNNIPYFQIFIIPDKIPYYDSKKNITKWEEISEHNLKKYKKLSNDNVDIFMHTPNKTFVGVIHLPECGLEITNFTQYKAFYYGKKNEIAWSNRTYDFGSSVIFNDYEQFIEKVAFFIKSI